MEERHSQAQTLLAITEAVGPAAAFLARRLLEQAAREASERCRDLLWYARSFTSPRVERAALRLLDYGIQDLDALRFLLEHDLDVLVGRLDVDFDGQLRLDLRVDDPSR
jgi:hypothetical protein